MFSVLTCGYGKIGAIKADIWRRLGANVVIVDSDPGKAAAARSNGFSAHTDLGQLKAQVLHELCAVDVSVPSGKHIATLRAALTAVPNCKLALVEKPLVSSRRELEELRQLLAEQGHSVHLLVNESYYASEGLSELKRLADSKGGVSSITVTFTKNRLPDIQAGRFVDEQLGPYGIEVPHMLACLKYLGFGDSELLASNWYQNVAGHMGSEGVRCELVSGRTRLRLIEVLGPFSVQPDLQFLPEPQVAVSRKVAVRFADSTSGLLEFDPVQGIGRYRSRLTTQGKVSIIEDDHLFTLLSRVMRYAKGDARVAPALRLAGVAESIQDNKKLLELRERAVISDFVHTTLHHAFAGGAT